MNGPPSLIPPRPIDAWKRAALAGLLALAIGLAGFGLSERIPRHRAGDGYTYTGLTMNGPDVVRRGFVESYYMQRTLVPLFLGGVLRVAGRDLDPDEVERAFYLWDVAMLGLTGVLFSLCADRLRLSRAGRWIGFLALFGNAGTLKWILYYPVLLDATALALGMAMLLAHVAGRPMLLSPIALIGAFCWPTVMLAALLLFLLPYQLRDTAEPTWSIPMPWLLGATVGGAMVAAAVALEVPSVVTPSMPGLGGLLGVAGYCMVVTACVARRVDVGWCRRLLGWDGFGRLVIAIAVVVVVRRVIQDYAFPAPPISDMFVFGYYALNHGTTAPLLFLVAHVAFFGPILLLAMRHGSALLDRLADGGPGLLALFGFGALLALTAESRQVFNFYPVIVLFAVKALDEARPGWRFVAAFGVVGLALSLVWLPFNHPLLAPYFWTTEGWQTLGLILGQRMSLVSYALWLPIFAVVAMVLLGILASGQAGMDRKGQAA